jgi:hypothetical protein
MARRAIVPWPPFGRWRAAERHVRVFVVRQTVSFLASEPIDDVSIRRWRAAWEHPMALEP